MADCTSVTTAATVAEVIAAAVQLPVFLVYEPVVGGQGQWREAAYAAVAESWHANNSSGWTNGSVVAFVSAVASFVSAALHTSMAKVPATSNSARLWQARTEALGEERHCIWTAQCEILLDWLRDVPLPEIATLAEFWMKRCYETADLVQTHSLLAPVRNRMNAFAPTHP